MTKQEEIREGIESRIRDVITASHVGEYHSVSIAAEGIMNYLHSKGVVIEVKGELPDSFCQCCKHYDTAREDTCNYGGYCGDDLVGWEFAGYEAVESLIEEE